MGLIVKNTTYDSGEDEIPIGTEVFIPLTDEKGIVVMKFGNLYQVETSSGVKTYARSEPEAVQLLTAFLFLAKMDIDEDKKGKTKIWRKK